MLRYLILSFISVSQRLSVFFSVPNSTFMFLTAEGP